METGILMQGNQACAKGALAAGATFFAGYPITPSTEIAEIMAEELPKIGGQFIQMEDEIASIGAVCGASLTGAKAFTATSGPGFSLMQELIGYATMAELPSVIVNVQRFGPSTGRPTSPAQADVMQARWGTHGDREAIVLTPSSVLETFNVTFTAFNFAERFRSPVVVLLDEVVGHMREKVILPQNSELKVFNRRQPRVQPSEYLPYKPDNLGIPSMPAFGGEYMYHVTGLSHGYNGLPTEDPGLTMELVARLQNKIYKYIDEITMFTENFMDDAEILVISYGCSARAAMAAVREARNEGKKVGLLKLISLWPFPKSVIRNKTRGMKKIVVPELNNGQVIREIERYTMCDNVVGVNRIDGEFFKPNEIKQHLCLYGKE